MGVAIDTVAMSRTTGGGGSDTTFQAVVVAAGDSLTVRAVPNAAKITLERFMTNAGAASAFRVRSPLLHDNVEGIQVYPGEQPMKQILPAYAAQQLQPQDTLVGEYIGVGTSAVNAAAIAIAYADLPGASARLHTWQDIANLIKSIKYLNVACGSGGAAAVWLDTVLTNTENLLHANTDYAVLGFVTDTAFCAVGLKGIDTSNLRICGPGTLDSIMTSDYFARWSVETGMPRIPVFNAANAPGTFMSVFDKAAPATTNHVQLLLAELAHNI